MQFSVFFTEPKQRGKNFGQGHGNALPCRKYESGSAAGGTAECAWEMTARAGTDAGTVRRRNSGGRDVLFSLSETKNAQRTPPARRTFFVVLVNNARAQRRSAREGQNSLPASGLASASSAALLLCLPPATQCPQHFFYLPPFLSENDFSALFWRKHIVIFAIPNRMQ